jgi:hypothetical protein
MAEEVVRERVQWVIFERVEGGMGQIGDCLRAVSGVMDRWKVERLQRRERYSVWSCLLARKIRVLGFFGEEVRVKGRSRDRGVDGEGGDGVGAG